MISCAKLLPLSLIFLFVSFANAQSSVLDSTSETELAMETRRQLSSQNYKSAAEAATKLAALTTDHRIRLIAADALLRCGDSKRALELFNAYIKAKPADKPYLWQRGIAQYFEGQFEQGAAQFEVHRKVNPNDVENAAWHFLCVAKRDSPEEAKNLLLPAPNDARPPMEEVLQLLRDGKTAPVTERMHSFPEGSSARESAMFYGNLYLGLYADASGDQKAAQSYLDLASKDAPANYMGDVARIYAQHLRD